MQAAAVAWLIRMTPWAKRLTSLATLAAAFSHDLDLVGTREEALKGADALIIATEWKVFQSADFEAIKSQLKQPAIFDGRNIYDPDFMKGQGFDYFAIGRGAR